jgi:indole-3-glycerol phosphate synthase
MDSLKPIVENTLSEVAGRKADTVYRRVVRARVKSSVKTRKLVPVAGGNSIIAELKFSSPSLGRIADGRVEDVVRDYSAGGAAAISVLTESKYFNGNLAFLERARRTTVLPILCKDFILDEFQLEEARSFGADGVLLIAGLLKERLGGMLDGARKLGLWCLVETHNGVEIAAALGAGAQIVGINNRDLNSMRMDLGTTIRLSELIPKNKILVTESGITSSREIAQLKEACRRKPDFYLVGTALMQAKEKGKSVRELAEA